MSLIRLHQHEDNEPFLVNPNSIRKAIRMLDHPYTIVTLPYKEEYIVRETLDDIEEMIRKAKPDDPNL